jgi:hypothetical protein
LSEAVIRGVRLTPTHDGESALVIELGFAGGGRSTVQIDGAGTRAVMAKANVASASDLVGLPWTVLDVGDPAFVGSREGREER